MLIEPRALGVVGSLRRYSVKSMQGDIIDRAVVNDRGILGNPAYAASIRR